MHWLVFINGLGFDQGGSTLLVTATISSQLLSYVLTAPDYRPIGAPELLHTFVDGWPDGMAVSSRGDYWVALTAGDRLDVIDAWGRCIGNVGLPAGSLPTNVCIGGRSTTTCSSPRRTTRRWCALLEGHGPPL